MSEENKTNEQNLYEVGFHIVSEDKAADELANIKAILSDNNVAVVKEGEPKIMDLAYTMIKKVNGVNQRFDKACFGWIKFTSGDTSNIEEIKKEIERNENILRYIIIKTVDDDEHSTVKILKDEEKEKVEETKPDTAEEVSGKEIDKAVDDLVR